MKLFRYGKWGIFAVAPLFVIFNFLPQKMAEEVGFSEKVTKSEAILPVLLSKSQKIPPNLSEQTGAEIPAQDSVLYTTSHVGLVTDSLVIIYSEPNVLSETNLTAWLGDVFFILEKWTGTPEWYHVAIHPGTVGWIIADGSVNAFESSREYQFQKRNSDWVHGKSKVENLEVFNTIEMEFPFTIDGENEIFRILNLTIVENDNNIEFIYGMHQGMYLPNYTYGPKFWVESDNVDLFYNSVLMKGSANVYGTPRNAPADYWDNTIKFLNIIANEYTDLPIIDDGGGGGAGYSLHSGTEALIKLSRVYVNMYDSTNAVNSLLRIRDEYENDAEDSGKHLGGRAMLALSEMYWRDFDDVEKAISQYLNIIRDYANVEYSLFERSTMFDIDALLGIRTAEFTKKINNEKLIDNEKLLDFFQHAIDLTDNDIVLVMGTVEKALVLREMGQYEQAVQVLMDIIDNYPSKSHTFFKEEYDYSVAALDLATNILSVFLDREDEALELCDEIYYQYNTNSDFLIWKAALFFKAEILDNGTAPRDSVIAAYESYISLSTPNEWIETPLRGNHRRIGTSRAQNRIQEIKSYNPETGNVRGEDVGLRRFSGMDSDIINGLGEGAELELQYRNTDNAITWIKVRTSEGDVGWLRENEFELIKDPIMVRPENFTSWQMWGGGVNRLKAIEGKPIVNPEILATIQDVMTREVLFMDVNDDGLPDLIICGIAGDPVDQNVENIRRNRVRREYNIVCLSGSDLSVLWKVKPRDNFFQRATPVIENGVLYCGALAINVSDGSVLWDSSMMISRYETALDGDHLVVFDDQRNGYFVFDKTSGTLLSKVSLDSVRFGRKPIVVDNKMYTAGNFYEFRENYRTQGDVNFVSMDLATIEILWRYPTQFRLSEASPVLSEGVLLGGLNNGRFYAIDAYSGQLKWIYTAYQPIRTQPAVKNGIVYASSGDGRIFAINISTGEELWTYFVEKLEGYSVSSSVCIVGDVLYAGSLNGKLYALQLADGKLIWQLDIGQPITDSISSAGKIISLITPTNTLFLVGEKR